MIVSVTICYQPDLMVLRRQLGSLRGQVGAMLVMNNGAESPDLSELCAAMQAQLTVLGTNTGIGHAQNLGIRRATEMGAHGVLLMDQDSEPDDGMVDHLAEALRAQPRAAAVGPCMLDVRTQQRTYFLMENHHRPRMWSPQPGLHGQTVAAAYLIASGCLLRVSALADIGLMREQWFIDLIDTEWCLRARARGWQVIGVADACLAHRLGDTVDTIWWLRRRQVPQHSPQRNYYMFRNTVLLMREPHVHTHWKRYHGQRLVISFLYFLLAAPQRGLRLRMMLRGVWDGIRGRDGAAA